MSNVKKLMMSAAGGAGLDVEDVFSIDLFVGNQTARSISNGLDLSTEGGMLWSKRRDGSSSHAVYDTERGLDYILSPNTNAQQYDYSGDITAANTDGYSMGYYSGIINGNGREYVNWVFRKAPNFFDIQTYSGNGSTQTISHNLGSVPGMIIIKSTSQINPGWVVWHREMTSHSYAMSLNSTAVQSTSYGFQSQAADANNIYLNNFLAANGSGYDFVAYIFAHNDGDGGFSSTGDKDIIKCGKYSGNGSSNPGQEVDIGFEPQFLLIKSLTGASSSWVLWDNMRGVGGHGDYYFYANSTAAETDLEQYDINRVDFLSNGFALRDNDSDSNSSSKTYAYMAIRKGTKIPENASDVFDVSTGIGTSSVPYRGRYHSDWPVDMALEKTMSTDNWELVSRLIQGSSMRPNDTNMEDTGNGGAKFDYAYGWNNGTAYTASYSWMWKGAPGFFDQLTYKGNGSNARSIPHNLEVVPEMMWVKSRTSSQNWIVLNPNERLQLLNQTAGEYSEAITADYFGNGTTYTAPTATHFTVSNSIAINGNNEDYLAFLFASLPGISKIGTYTGNGGTQTINCGFSNGAKFILIKRTDNSGDWDVWDSERGIVAGADGFVYLNSNAAETTAYDGIDPTSSGFIVNNTITSLHNASGASYMFYAIAI